MLRLAASRNDDRQAKRSLPLAMQCPRQLSLVPPLRVGPLEFLSPLPARSQTTCRDSPLSTGSSISGCKVTPQFQAGLTQGELVSYGKLHIESALQSVQSGTGEPHYLPSSKANKYVGDSPNILFIHHHLSLILSASPCWALPQDSTS